MGSETRKHDTRRLKDPAYASLFKGRGIDIGCGKVPVVEGCDEWDKPHGDATFLEGVPSRYYDWVYSSHCLEHLRSPYVAVRNWWRVLKEGGHMIVTVPDFFLYEKKKWPSPFNKDHKFAFSILDRHHTLEVASLFSILKGCQIRWIKTNDLNFDYEDTKSDQTLGPAQSEIEIVAKKIDPFWTEV